MTREEVEEFIRGRISHYRKFLPRKDAEGRDMPDTGKWKDPGNIMMAKRIIWLYEQELKKGEEE